MKHRSGGDATSTVWNPFTELTKDAAAKSPLSVDDAAVVACSCDAAHQTDKRLRHAQPLLWFPGLLSACLSYLDGITLLTCELVAREWYTTLQDSALWAHQYCATWRHGKPLPAILYNSISDQLKRICRARRSLPLGLSTRATWWVHATRETLCIHNHSLQRAFSRGCIESIRTDHALHPLGVCATLYYYEVTIRGCGSVGVVRLSQPHIGRFYGAGASSHLGWLPGSYGYHGDDGKIYWHDGRAPPGGYAVHYGPSWGDTRALQRALPAENDDDQESTIGCGVNVATGGSLFFTKNGAFLGHASMRVAPSRDGIAAAVSLHHLGDTAELNLGRAPFAFDIEAYVADGVSSQETATIA